MSNDASAQEIQFSVRNPSGFNLSLAAPADTLISDLITTIQQEEPAQFPRSDRSGQPIHYSLVNSRTGSYLDSAKTLAAAEVREGDVLEASFKFISAH